MHALDTVRVGVAEQRVFPAAERVVRHRYGDRHVDADHADFDLVLPATESARRLRTALDANGDWMGEVLRDADNKLEEVRAGGHPDAGGLVIASDQNHARAIARRLNLICGEKPEMWAYYADYDWVAMCQLFGTMMDLPKGWPMYCRDLKQLAGDTSLPEQGKGEHHALADARWTRDAWHYVTKLKAAATDY